MIWIQIIGWAVVVTLFIVWLRGFLRQRRYRRWRAWVATMPAPVEALRLDVHPHRGFTDFSFPSRPGVTHFQLPDDCPHNDDDATGCRWCNEERAILDAGGELPEQDRPRPLPIPVEDARAILMQLPAPDPMVAENERPAVPAWSLQHALEEVEFWGLLHTLELYGLVQLVNSDWDPPELRVRLTEAGEWSRGTVLPPLAQSDDGAPA